MEPKSAASAARATPDAAGEKRHWKQLASTALPAPLRRACAPLAALLLPLVGTLLAGAAAVAN